MTTKPLKTAFLSLSHSFVALAALRGGIVVTMGIIANLITVQEMGQLSAVYSVSVAGAQIVGYALNILALDLAKDTPSTADAESKMALSCLSCWLLVSLLIISCAAFAQTAVRSFLFSDIVSPFLFEMGSFWLCGMAFEMIAVAAAVGMQKMRLMASVGFLQAILMVTATPFAVLTFGYQGIVVLAALSFGSGLALFWSMKPWNALYAWRHVLKSIMQKVPNTIGPSILAATLLTALNILLVYHISHKQQPFYQLAVFSVAMQVLSVLSFFPQVIYNFTMNKYYSSLKNSEINFNIIFKGCIFSFLACLFSFLIISYFQDFILFLYGQKYAQAGNAIVLVGLILLAQGPLQILTQQYVIEKRQWELAIICGLSTALGYSFFIYQFEVSAVTMLKSLLVANLVRGLLVVISLFGRCSINANKK